MSFLLLTIIIRPVYWLVSLQIVINLVGEVCRGSQGLRVLIIEGLNLIRSPFECFGIIEQGIIFYTYLLGPVLKLAGELPALEDLLDLLFGVLVVDDQ